MKLWLWYEDSNNAWILKVNAYGFFLYMRMSTTEAPTGKYSHPASGMWTPTYLYTRRSGEGAVETFGMEIGQSVWMSVCQGLIYHLAPVAYEWVRSGSPSSITFETCPSREPSRLAMASRLLYQISLFLA
ncbi:hypothetical protein ARMSODRAFT_967748 [Armillaria solidipes]|uniref:Uncharacterized protein n=1 Tax=Armillaria solidipes TaxID=1076256 RepID=A0A2H3AHJ9_9AGAR|nr:hypothetical protein ARMSODRAFT_967748 [Armillaria solidipes]